MLYLHSLLLMRYLFGQTAVFIQDGGQGTLTLNFSVLAHLYHIVRNGSHDGNIMCLRIEAQSGALRLVGGGETDHEKYSTVVEKITPKALFDDPLRSVDILSYAQQVFQSIATIMTA
jgi:hypothetical protein